VHVGKKASWVGLDLLDLEAGTSVSAVGDDASSERTGHAAEGVALVTLADRVRECESWGTVLAHGPLVDVGGGLCGGLVLAREADELDVPADQVEVGVDAEVVVADGAWEAAGEDWIGGAIDDLVGSCDDGIGRGEVAEGWWTVCAVGSGAWWVLDVLPATWRSWVLVEVGASAGWVLD